MRFHGSAFVAALACWPGLPAALTAQASQATAEIGATSVRQRDVPRTEAVTAAVGFRHDAPRFAFAAVAGLTLAGANRSTTQGLLTASVLDRPDRWMRWELGAALTAFDQEVLPLTRGAYVYAREHFTIGRSRAWAGVTFGGVEDHRHWSPTRSVEAGSVFGTRFARLTATAVVVDTRSEPYAPSGGASGELVTDPITYTDAALAGRWVIRERAELDARGGVRLISRGALTPSGRGTRAFASVDAAYRLTPQLTFAASVGRQLSDLARGTPDTRFATLALRVSVRTPSRPSPPLRRPAVAPTERPRLVLVADSAGHSLAVVVAAPADGLVEVAASFTSWEPVALVRRADRWELDRTIPPGAHRVLVRINGGLWIVPANLPGAPDDFGGTVGLLTVP
jgi:hypothetical protein